MSEFEIASLDYQTATLAVREWMFWIAAASLAVSAIVGGAQCWLIWRGLRTMERAGDARDRQLDLAEKRHIENMRRLDEQNRRFDALIEGQADQRQALSAAVASLNEQTSTLNAQTAASTRSSKDRPNSAAPAPREPAPWKPCSTAPRRRAHRPAAARTAP